ncbi:MAG: NAD(P)-dependent oxidoreductase [Mucinivorans sp.]
MDRCRQILDYITPYYTPSDYAALGAQYAEWVRTRPLDGLRILDATPLFRNTLLKYRNLLAAGADLTIGLSPFISHNDQVLRFVSQELGLSTRSTDESRQADNNYYDLILDCAGAFANCEAKIGYVELTRSGTEYYKDCTKPVYLADSSRIKEIETEYGTGESFFRAMNQLGYHDFKDKNLVIFGAGKVGRGIRREATRQGCCITVVSDRETAPKDCTTIDYTDHRAATEAVCQAWAVVMATGVRGALSQTVDPRAVAQSQALLINMGAEDEFGEKFAPDRLVERGRTLNFILDEPTHLRYIDPTMTLHNYGALFVKEHRHLSGIITPDKMVEKLILNNSKINL